MLCKALLRFLAIAIVLNTIPTTVHAECVLETRPYDILQCITINPQTLVNLLVTKDLSNLCETVNVYMQCMRSYFKDCIGGNLAIGALDELTDLNYKCCVSKDVSKCITKNPKLVQNCFSSDNFVTLSDNSRKSIINVSIGDVVKAIDSNGNIINTEVVSILHKETEESGLFYEFETSNGDWISLTGNHLVKIDGKGYIKAEDVQLNDTIKAVSIAMSQVAKSNIIKIKQSVKTGYIAPLTHSGTILVNNIDASCYATVNSQFIGDLAMQPLKLWNSIAKIFGYEQDSQTRGMNTYASLLHTFTSYFMPFLLK